MGDVAGEMGLPDEPDNIEVWLEDMSDI